MLKEIESILSIYLWVLYIWRSVFGSYLAWVVCGIGTHQTLCTERVHFFVVKQPKRNKGFPTPTFTTPFDILEASVAACGSCGISLGDGIATNIKL